MATNNANTAAPKAAKDDYVEVFIPKTSEIDDPNFYVSINGVRYILPKGKASKVPAHVAEEIYRSREAQEKLDRTIDALTAEASK